MSDSDTVPRPAGCVCTWEQGDSDCPVHVQCSECGADISHQAVVVSLKQARVDLERVTKERDSYARSDFERQLSDARGESAAPREELTKARDDQDGTERQRCEMEARLNEMIRLHDEVEQERNALRERQQELLVTIRNLSSQVPYVEESRTAATLIAEVGTLRSQLSSAHAECEQARRAARQWEANHEEARGLYLEAKAERDGWENERNEWKQVADAACTEVTEARDRMAIVEARMHQRRAERDSLSTSNAGLREQVAGLTAELEGARLGGAVLRERNARHTCDQERIAAADGRTDRAIIERDEARTEAAALREQVERIAKAEVTAIREVERLQANLDDICERCQERCEHKPSAIRQGLHRKP